jgi:excisionase family DNA binding protein
MQDLLRPADVARKLGVSRTWLYDAARDGRVPAVRIGGPTGPLRFVARRSEPCSGRGSVSHAGLSSRRSGRRFKSSRS